MTAETMRDKLLWIETALADAADLARESDETLARERRLQLAMAHVLQTLTEAAADLNNLMLMERGGAPASGCKDSFFQLVEAGLLSADLATRMQEYCDLRNVIVHLYDRVDARRLTRALRGARRDFEEYMRAVHDALSE